jgi:hypothetical protein
VIVNDAGESFVVASCGFRSFKGASMNPVNEMASILARLEGLDQLEAKLRNELEAVHIMRAENHLGRIHQWLEEMEGDVEVHL